MAVLLGALMVPAILPAQPQEPKEKEKEQEKEKKRPQEKDKRPAPRTREREKPATTPVHPQVQPPQQQPQAQPAQRSEPSRQEPPQQQPQAQPPQRSEPSRREQPQQQPQAQPPQRGEPSRREPPSQQPQAQPAQQPQAQPAQQPQAQQPGQRQNQPFTRGDNPGRRAPGTNASTEPSTPGNRAPGRMAAPAPNRSFSDARTGRQWEVNNRGQVATIRDERAGITVHRGFGEHHIVTVRPDHSRIVSISARVGFVERPLGRPGFVARTYVVGGRSYARVYRAQPYRGIVVYRYVPAYYYAPAYYGWVVNPWYAPVRYRWGWYSDPWARYYGGYFAPAPYYANASLWLTDYLIAENLRLAYENQQLQAQQAQQDGYPPPAGYQGGAGGYDQSAGAPALTPELKQAIAAEVQQQLAQQQADAAYQSQNDGQQQPPPPDYADNVPPPALDPNQRIFIVPSTLNIPTADGGTCQLTPADMILRTDTNVQDGDQVAVSVLSAKPGNCPVNTPAMVQVAALQEMHNQFAAQITEGLKALGDAQGKGGLPPAPTIGQRPSAQGQVQADAGAASELQQQQQQAQQMEADIRKNPPPNNPDRP